jgi:hypothetical protein
MTDRNTISQVIESLFEDWIDKNINVHPLAVENMRILESDALALLKEQPHGETFTVIDTKTGKEADEYNIALHEEWANHLCYCDMEGWAIENDGTLLLVDECGKFAYADKERFKVVWDA